MTFDLTVGLFWVEVVGCSFLEVFTFVASVGAFFAVVVVGLVFVVVVVVFFVLVLSSRTVFEDEDGDVPSRLSNSF